MATPEISRPEKHRGFPSPKKESRLYHDFIRFYAEPIADYTRVRLPDWRPTPNQLFLLSMIYYGIYFYGDTLFTTEKVIQENPDLVKRFVLASMKGWQFAYDNPEKAVDYVLMYSDQLNKEQEMLGMKASLELIKPDDKPVGTIEKFFFFQAEDGIRDDLVTGVQTCALPI